MDQILALGNAYARDFAIVFSIFVIFFVLIGFLFARGQSLRLLKGLLINFVWIFASPFLYVKKTIGDIAGINSDSSHHDVAHDQYLITRFLFILRTTVVLIAIGILAASVAKGWEDFLPAKYLRMAEASTQRALDSLKKQEDSLRSTIMAQDNDWNSKKDQIIRQHQQNRAKRASDAISANHGLEAALKTDPQSMQALNALQNFLQNQPHATEPAIANVRRNAGYLIAQLSTSNSDTLRQYADNWEAAEVNTLQETSPEDAARADVQNDYKQNKLAIINLTEQDTRTTQELVQIQQQEKYSPDQFFVDLVEGVISFILFVWGLGLILEALLIAIFIARDVHLIRAAKNIPFSGKDIA